MPREKPNYKTPTPEDSHADGFLSGVAWDADWVPGGPWVIRPGLMHNYDPDWVAYCNRLVINNNEYMRGWYEGVIQNHENSPNQWVKNNIQRLMAEYERDFVKRRGGVS